MPEPLPERLMGSVWESPNSSVMGKLPQWCSRATKVENRCLGEESMYLCDR